MSKPPTPITERFWSRIKVLTAKDCWEWQGYLSPKGYGKIFIERGKSMMLVHRFSYILHHGSIPDNLFVLHRCDNPRCVNPNHLWLGTKNDNNQDCIAKGRRNNVGSKGESHPNVSLTDAQVIEIRNLFANHRTIQEIATQYGMSHGAISHIVKGRSWKHLL